MSIGYTFNILGKSPYIICQNIKTINGLRKIKDPKQERGLTRDLFYSKLKIVIYYNQ